MIRIINEVILQIKKQKYCKKGTSSGSHLITVYVTEKRARVHRTRAEGSSSNKTPRAGHCKVSGHAGRISHH